jgi:hypothetical protein
MIGDKGSQTGRPVGKSADSAWKKSSAAAYHAA